MSNPKETIVVGGGLIGLFCAHYLQRAGHQVTVLERDRVGSGAARGNGGWVCPSRSKPMPSPEALKEGLTSWFKPSSPLYIKPAHMPAIMGFLTRFALSSSARKLARGWDAMDTLNTSTHGLFDLLREEGIAPELDEHGFLPVFENRATAERSRAGWMDTAKRGLAPEPGSILSRNDLRALEPALGEAAKFGFLNPGDRWLDPNRLVEGLSASLEQRGVEVNTGNAVQSVRQVGERVHVQTSDSEWTSDYVVVAAGAWSTELLGQLGVNAMVVPGKGYSFTVEPSVMPLHNIQCGASNVAATPLPDRLRIVGTVEFDGTFDTINEDRIQLMRQGASPFLSGINWEHLREEWAAPRPMTPDGLPLIGRIPGHDRVIAATGHNMLGLSQGPATATMVRDVLESGVQSMNPAFDPARFGSKAWLKAK